MRRWLLFGGLTLGVAGIGGYAYFLTDSAPPARNERLRPQEDVKRQVRNDGDAELSEAIEPIVVDRGAPVRPASVMPPAEEPLPRVVQTPGTRQPPRPDTEPGRAPLRMPYADEEGFFPIPLDPVTRIQQSTLPPLQLPDERD